jgi:hypothetical protein
MRKRKPAKKKPTSRKTINSRKKTVQRKKQAKRSKGPSGGSSAQIHQGVGIVAREGEVSSNDL